MRANHHAIYVETAPTERSGLKYHVTGTVMRGMVFEVKEVSDLEISASFVDKRLLGRVKMTDLQRLEEVCRSIDPPPRQYDDRLRLINPGVPTYHCQHWTRDALQALRETGVIQE
ncbi:hypothetical protein EV182_007891 [Spiromyces aspiralis]|uniref:Uncharacterized protein n=1 Tax=Spiromyces aspiralis TaxID=68401 RepID=A0ACC1HAK8_9FUNG|nr:hypothetical protein EV182_007891 [Spiromyces aspiralis]